MDRKEIIKAMTEDIKKYFEAEHTGHDAAHTLRVLHTARIIAREENADLFIVSAAVLLHDVDDYKISAGTEETHDNARRIMAKYQFSQAQMDRVCRIIEQVSFSGKDSVVPDSIEGKAVQDADRLDALGAIGIARAFAYGGAHHRKLYEPGEVYGKDMTKEEYRASTSSTIAHFYEKLLLLKDMMNTAAGRQMAQHRHDFMEMFLDEFDAEWEGRI